MALIDYYRQGQADKQAREEEARGRQFGELAGTLATAKDRAPVLAQMSALKPQQALQFGQFYQGQDQLAAEKAKAQEREAAGLTLNKLKVVRSAPPGRKIEAIKYVAPEWYAQNMADGIPPTDEEIDGYLDKELPNWYSKSGQAMPEPQQETFTGQPQEMLINGKPGMGRLGSRGTLQQVPGATPIPKQAELRPSYKFIPKTLPDGRVQQFRVNANDPSDQGEPWGEPSSPKLSVTEEKARQNARAKLPTVDAAIRRLERIEQASSKLTFGGGPIDAKALALTPSYKELEQAAASFMPVLTTLTRVPGIGSQSDLEQRLAQLQIPSGDMYPETRAKAIQELKLFIDDLRQAYVNVSEGSAPQIQQQAPSQQSAPGGVKFLGFE